MGDIVNEVRSHKEQVMAKPYHDNPRVSVCVLSFNNIDNIDNLYKGLKASGAEEIIVCEDGSIDGSYEKWSELLKDRNDFIIRSNDIHEIRAYDRALKMARGEFVVMIQDDDQLPENGDWLNEVLTYFEKYPDMGLFGCFWGFYGIIPGEGFKGVEYHKRDQNSFDYENFRFTFVHQVNNGPMVLRRKIYEEVGGFDFDFSKVGESGIEFDHAFSLQCWLNGWKVGHKEYLIKKIPMPGEAWEGGTFKYGCNREENRKINRQLMINKFSGKRSEINALVEAANRNRK